MMIRIRIDHRFCSGVGECAGIAPEVFLLGDDNLCIVVDPEGGDDDIGLDAACGCPVDAITLLGGF